MNAPNMQSLILWIRRIRYILVAVTLIALIIIFYRFGIVQIPNNYSKFSAGSYVLVDWKWQLGRALGPDDWIIFHKEGNTQAKLGLIKTYDTASSSYFVFLEDTNTTVLVHQNQIQARILVVLMSPSTTPPK